MRELAGGREGWGGELAEIAIGHLGFSSQSVGRTSSWAKLRAVQKKEQPLKNVMQRKRRWSRDVQPGEEAELGRLECVRTQRVVLGEWEAGEAEKCSMG